MNPKHSRWQREALPLSYPRKQHNPPGCSSNQRLSLKENCYSGDQMRMGRVELPPRKGQDSKSCASANSATSASDIVLPDCSSNPGLFLKENCSSWNPPPADAFHSQYRSQIAGWFTCRFMGTLSPLTRHSKPVHRRDALVPLSPLKIISEEYFINNPAT